MSTLKCWLEQEYNMVCSCGLTLLPKTRFECHIISKYIEYQETFFSNTINWMHTNTSSQSYIANRFEFYHQLHKSQKIIVTWGHMLVLKYFLAIITTLGTLTYFNFFSSTSIISHTRTIEGWYLYFSYFLNMIHLIL